MDIALTRPNYVVTLIGCKVYGVSPLLEGTVYYEHINLIEYLLPPVPDPFVEL